MHNHQVQVPHSFFQKSKREYKHWAFSFFRELIQNSNDAKSTEINFNIYNDDESVVIECDDNGKGMSKDILINKLLCLGGSHKDEGSTGGFGYAKTLLFFAHKAYEVKTKNFIVNGTGGNYDIKESSDYIDGTHIKVVMERDCDRQTNVSFLIGELEKIVFLSSFKTNIFLNDDILEQDFNSFDFKVNTPIGKLRFNDTNKRYSSLWVRVNGIPMFSESFYDNDGSCFEGVIELDKQSTDVLTSNRDSLKDQAEADFRTIIKSLQKERSALKSPSFEELVLNKQNILMDENVHYENDESESHDTEQVHAFSDSENESKDYSEEPLTSDFNPFRKIKKKVESQKNSAYKVFDKINNNLYSDNFHISLSNSRLTYAQIKDELNKKRNEKLAELWIKSCKAVLFSVMRNSRYDWRFNKRNGVYFYDDKPIHFGFMFSNDVYAVNQKSNSEYKLLLNPVSFRELILGNHYDKQYGNNRKLVDLAIHEITHLFQDFHDESFSSIENEIKWCFYNTQSVMDINIDNLLI